MTSLDVISRQINCCNYLCCKTHERTLSEDHLFAFILIGTPPHSHFEQCNQQLSNLICQNCDGSIKILLEVGNQQHAV